MSVRRIQARSSRLAVVTLAGLLLTSGVAWALGFELSETKEQLKLDYQVSVTDPGTGRVMVEFTLANEGRLKPLTSVDLVVPPPGGSGHLDLSVPIALREAGGKRKASMQLTRELAERAQIQLQTFTLDGKPRDRTWYYHVIRLAQYLQK